MRALVLIATLALAACGSGKEWARPGTDAATAAQDAARCRLMAQGVAPLQYPQPAPTYQATTTGTVTGSATQGATYPTYYSGTYSSTTTYQPQPQMNWAAMGAAVQHRRAQEDCMVAAGYSLQPAPQ